MRKVPVEQAIGLVLAHDVTEISAERRIKRRAFRRGHVICAEDVARLKDLGKNEIFIDEDCDRDSALGPGKSVHEDDAALTVAPLAAGLGIEHDPEPSEGKINFRATCSGLFKVDKDRQLLINSLAIPSFPTIPDNFPVDKGRTVAAFRIIPLTCERKIIDRVMEILDTPLLQVMPYRVKTAGVVVTGNEVFEGRITDGFVPRLTYILSPFGVRVISSEILPDDREKISAAVSRTAEACDLVFVTGGTSVDPDDVTVGGMVDAGVKILTKGAPIQPGNNFTIGYRAGIPVCAVPAAAIFHQTTALDIFLPRLLAGDCITPAEISSMGHGGLCLQCPECTFPICTFGKP
ncbi:MAG: molybdopterin-binding protein [Gemmatimonadales bacterium]|nr:molybdopterin-binding protein [Gemmatimonadales bacterium]